MKPGLNDHESGGGDDRNDDVRHAGTAIEHRGRTYFVDHKQNARGHYVKLVESRAGRRVTVILPAEVLVGLARFLGQSAQRAGVLHLSSPSPS